MGKNPLNGLSLLADSWLRLVVSKPAQAAGVEINLRGLSWTHVVPDASPPICYQHSAIRTQTGTCKTSSGFEGRPFALLIMSAINWPVVRINTVTGDTAVLAFRADQLRSFPLPLCKRENKRSVVDSSA